MFSILYVSLERLCPTLFRLPILNVFLKKSEWYKLKCESMIILSRSVNGVLLQHLGVVRSEILKVLAALFHDTCMYCTLPEIG